MRRENLQHIEMWNLGLGYVVVSERNYTQRRQPDPLKNVVGTWVDHTHTAFTVSHCMS